MCPIHAHIKCNSIQRCSENRRMYEWCEHLTNLLQWDPKPPNYLWVQDHWSEWEGVHVIPHRSTSLFLSFLRFVENGCLSPKNMLHFHGSSSKNTSSKKLLSSLEGSARHALVDWDQQLILERTESLNQWNLSLTLDFRWSSSRLHKNEVWRHVYIGMVPLVNEGS